MNEELEARVPMCVGLDWHVQFIDSDSGIFVTKFVDTKWNTRATIRVDTSSSTFATNQQIQMFGGLKLNCICI